MVEDVHFRWSTTDARSLGIKVLASALSDLSAMGARPLGFLLSLGLPGDAPAARLEGFLRGLLGEARRAGCPLVGGDTVASPHWSLALSVTGEVPRGRCLRRSAARPGDRLMVTGTLGAAALGLALLERGRAGRKGAAAFVRRQLRPRPPLEVGPHLVRAKLARAAIDLSDGLSLDLDRMLRASRVGARIELDRLPLAPGLHTHAAALGLDALSLALHGGEDYELLFAVAPGAPSAAALGRRLGCRVTELAVLERGRSARYEHRGERVAITAHGYDHFKRPATQSDK